MTPHSRCTKGVSRVVAFSPAPVGRPTRSPFARCRYLQSQLHGPCTIGNTSWRPYQPGWCQGRSVNLVPHCGPRSTPQRDHTRGRRSPQRRTFVPPGRPIRRCGAPSAEHGAARARNGWPCRENRLLEPGRSAPATPRGVAATRSPSRATRSPSPGIGFPVGPRVDPQRAGLTHRQNFDDPPLGRVDPHLATSIPPGNFVDPLFRRLDPRVE